MLSLAKLSLEERAANIERRDQWIRFLNQHLPDTNGEYISNEVRIMNYYQTHDPNEEVGRILSSYFDEALSLRASIEKKMTPWTGFKERFPKVFDRIDLRLSSFFERVDEEFGEFEVNLGTKPISVGMKNGALLAGISATVMTSLVLLSPEFRDTFVQHNFYENFNIVTSYVLGSSIVGGILTTTLGYGMRAKESVKNSFSSYSNSHNSNIQ